MTVIHIVTIMFLGTLIYLCLMLARKIGGLEKENDIQKDMEEVERARDEIASRADDSADKLLERMRSPHNNH